MSDDLPMGWDRAFLGDVCEIARGGSPRPIQKYLTDDPEGINWIKISDATESEKYIFKTKQKITRDGISNSRLVKDGDFILSNSMSFGRPYIVRTEGCIHDGWLVLSVNDEVFNPDYLYCFLGSQEAYSQFNSKAAGSTVRNLNIEIVKTVEAIVPPLNEQRRIVDKLDRIGDRHRTARNELSHIPKLIARYKQAVLAAAFRGDLTADWRNQNNEIILDSEEFLFVNYSNEYEFPDLPNSWILSCIDKIGNVKGGKRLPKGEKLVDWNTGFPYIRAGNLKNGTVVTYELLFVTEDIRKVIRNYTVSSGDVYITIVGACIGDAGIIPKNLDGANLTENAAKICDLKQCDNQYLALWLRSSICQDIINHKTLSAAQGKLALTRIKTIPIPLTPLEEQKEIVRRVEKMFEKIDMMEQEYQKAAKLCDRLEQATLAKAFRGDLVPQDPNDEPASVLLEQVKSQKKKGKIKSKK